METYITIIHYCYSKRGYQFEGGVAKKGVSGTETERDWKEEREGVSGVNLFKLNMYKNNKKIKGKIYEIISCKMKGSRCVCVYLET